MSVRNRKYREMSTDEVCKDFTHKSNRSIHSLLLHYKQTGDKEMLSKLKTAYELAKIERAKLKLQAKEHEITSNITK